MAATVCEAAECSAAWPGGPEVGPVHQHREGRCGRVGSEEAIQEGPLDIKERALAGRAGLWARGLTIWLGCLARRLAGWLATWLAGWLSVLGWLGWGAWSLGLGGLEWSWAIWVGCT